MKIFHLIAALSIAAPFVSLAETAYIADVIFPGGSELSLNLDAEGHAIKDYDAFVTFPSAFESENGALPRPTEWDKRGIGTFAEFTVIQQDGQLVATLFLEDAELGEWNETKVKDITIIRLPSFRSTNVKSTNLCFILGQWIHLGGYTSDGANHVIKIRIRENSSQQSGPGYPPQGVRSPDP